MTCRNVGIFPTPLADSTPRFDHLYVCDLLFYPTLRVDVLRPLSESFRHSDTWPAPATGERP